MNILKSASKIAIALIKSGFSNRLINGPILKKNFLKKIILSSLRYFLKSFDQ